MSQSSALRGALRSGGMALVLVCVLLRAAVSYDPFPYWSMDPLHMPAAVVGLAPMQSQVVDVLTMLGAGMVLLGEALGAGLLLWPTLLGLAGAVGVGLHAFVLRGWELDHARIGGTWIAAIFAALAALHACRDARVGRLVVAIAISASVLFVARGLVQVFIEHPETVRQYRMNKDAFIAAQGWAPGSRSVAIFERRLNQPEATGWFGLSNVFASFAAAAVVAYLGWTVQGFWLRTRNRFPEGWAAVLAIGLVLAVVGLYFSRSKGGIGAAGVGLIALALAGLACAGSVLPKLRGLCEPRYGGLLALTLVACALLAIAARGVVGERLGELSLLFRAFYMEGAARIFAAHPIFGVGPDGFKAAYLVAKPPLSPEEVQSPHSVLFDFAATLGSFGVAWCGLFLWMVWRAGRAFAVAETATRDAAQASSRELRLDAWACVLVPFAVIVFNIYLEAAALTPDSAALRLVGMLAWVGAAIAALALMRATEAWRVPAAAAALALAVHAQIEVTPVWPASAGLFLVIIGAVAGASLRPVSGEAPAPLGRRRKWAHVVVAACVLAGAVLWSRAALMPMARWQQSLQAAAAAFAPVAEINQRLDALRRGQGFGDTPVQVAGDLAALTGLPVPSDQREFDFAMASLLVGRGRIGIAPLGEAAAIAPSHTPTIEALARVYLAMAGAARGIGLNEDRSAEAAEDVAARHAADQPSASSLAMLANVRVARYDLDRDADHLYRAAEALEAADRLDPYGLQFPQRLARLYVRLRERGEAAEWAQIALERDKLQRLDPLRRLTDPERRELEEARAGAEPPS